MKRLNDQKLAYEKNLEDKLNEEIQKKLNQFTSDNNPPSAPELLDENNFNKPGVSDKSAVPAVDRTTKPSYSSITKTEETNSPVIVPKSLVNKFLNIAKANTFDNLETCGILAGKLVSKAFIISHLLIPPQKATSDSCSTQDEEKLFLFQEENDLITLGWIHTHPTQSSFMSSIDLHTHCSYQLMLSEAIAIVCAPKFDQIGVYSLTSDYGINFIAKCQLSGFHPHPDFPPLYEESRHVIFDNNNDVQLVDLR